MGFIKKTTAEKVEAVEKDRLEAEDGKKPKLAAIKPSK